MHDSFLLDLCSFALNHNYFLFDRQYYRQTSGVAMGARFAPSYANLFLGWWEATVVYRSEFFERFVTHWRRFIDDVIFIWSGPEEVCHDFLRSLNDNDMNIFLTYTISPSTATFLDLQVRIKDGRLETGLYRKPTATNSLLSFDSFHPFHTRRGVPIGQFLRVRRNCTLSEEFRTQANDLTHRFRRRGYPRSVLSNAYRRAKNETQQSLIQKQPAKGDQPLRLVTDYNNQWKQVKQILSKNWAILTSDPQVSSLVSDTPLLTARRAPRLRDMLTSSHFRRPTVRLQRGIVLKGSFPCGACSVCPHVHPTREHFVDPCDANKKYTLHSYINCKTVNVVYAIVCDCPKVYVGQTSQELRKRIQKHISTINLAATDLKKAHFLSRFNWDPAPWVTLDGRTTARNDMVELGDQSMLIGKVDGKDQD
ncbi:uncharacterized protein ACNLHF_017504 isoform 1-T1 [Anomaloglossus baeobatrachus]|uniref:uncharacterized protein LOC142291015 isoform X1 n=1 Tax=Anomaloglossus baeobatrachus TaxID=238106 RepID=UPI003F4FFC06